MDGIRSNEQKEIRKGVYDFLVIFITENGYAPSVKEILDGTGIKSTSTVRYHLEMFDKVGKIKVAAYIQRDKAGRI
jgi:repressor LexA